MSLYNLLFGMNDQTALLLAVIGLRRNDVERLRDTSASDDGSEIAVYTRTGGGNRHDFPNLTMRKRPEWQGSEDDDFDSTYCTDTFLVPEEWREDVRGLGDVLTHGVRREFALHLAKTLRREPTEDDKATALLEAERVALARTPHSLANGHTFVPYDDAAMAVALAHAEANGGKLRSAWGIMPIEIVVERDVQPFPKSPHEETRQHYVRVNVRTDYGWKLDLPYWEHCEARWSEKFPLSIAAIDDAVKALLARTNNR